MSSMVAEKIGMSDGGHFFLTAERDNRLALMGYRYPCSPLGVGYVALSLQVDQMKTAEHPSRDLCMLFRMFNNAGCLLFCCQKR